MILASALLALGLVAAEDVTVSTNKVCQQSKQSSYLYLCASFPGENTRREGGLWVWTILLRLQGNPLR